MVIKHVTVTQLMPYREHGFPCPKLSIKKWRDERTTQTDPPTLSLVVLAGRV